MTWSDLLTVMGAAAAPALLTFVQQLVNGAVARQTAARLELTAAKVDHTAATVEHVKDLVNGQSVKLEQVANISGQLTGRKELLAEQAASKP